MFELKASFFLRCKVQCNGGDPKGKEVGHLFLLTLLWCTKEYGDKRGRNPATLLLINPLSGDTQQRPCPQVHQGLSQEVYGR